MGGDRLSVEPDAFNAFEAAGWEGKAGGYDSFVGEITGRLVDPLLDAAGVGQGTRVLDVATGPGYAAARAAERGASIVGVDVAEAMLELARERNPGLEFRQGDAHSLPFEDASFDAVVANFLLLHLGRAEQAAAEFARVLAPGGRLAATVWDRPEEARLFGVFLDAFAEAGATPPDDIPAGPDFFRFSDDEEFDSLLRDQGLEEREVKAVTFPWRVGTLDEFWDGLLGGAVRTSALIERQPEEKRVRIREAFDRIAGEYRSGEEFEFPVSVKLGSGRKPAA